MRSALRLALGLLLTLAAARAAALERDLGQALSYVRVQTVPADLPGTPAKLARSIVLDLRYVAGDEAGAAALDAWLKFRAGPAHPVFILVNTGTAPAVRRMLAARTSATGLLALGAATAEFVPDILIEGPPEAERAAYDALAAGATVDSLTVDQPDKPRHDEAELMRQHANPSAASAEPSAPAPAPAAAPVIDRALQRALQIHRALLALRKLPVA